MLQAFRWVVHRALAITVGMPVSRDAVVAERWGDGCSGSESERSSVVLLLVLLLLLDSSTGYTLGQ